MNIDARMMARLLVLLPLAVGVLANAPAVAQVSTRYVYDAAGQLLQVIETDGTTITYEYDVVGNLLRRLVTSPSNASGAVTGISPSAMEPATEAEITIFGVGLAAATDVTFDVPEITASVIGTPEANALFLRVAVGATVSPGPHTFTVNRTSQPPIASGSVALNVSAVPTLVQVSPTQVLTGNTIDPFTLSGARLNQSPVVNFDKPGFTLTNVTTSADGTSLTGRLQVLLSAAEGPVGIRVTTSEGTTKKVTLAVTRSAPGLSGTYFANVFTLDSAGLPVIPATSPSFIRSDAALQFGTSTGFRFRPCFFGSFACLNGAYTARWHGYILLPAAGNYVFALNSSDASQLSISGNPVVSNPGAHAATTVQGVFNAPAAGSYPVVVTFNTSGATPGIDLLYQPPGAASLSPVPASVLWGDGSVYDPVLSSAAAAVSWSNPAAPPSPGVPAATAGAAATVSFANPAPTPVPGIAASIGGTSSAVSFFNPAGVPVPGVASQTAFADAVVSFFSPAVVPAPGAASGTAAASAVVSFSNPAPTVSPGAPGSLSAAFEAVAFAAGPVVYAVAPAQLSRSAGGGVLTIKGKNLQGATTVLFENVGGLTASPPSVSADGTTATTTVTITTSAPTGFAGVRVSTPTGVSAVGSPVRLEIVP